VSTGNGGPTARAVADPARRRIAAATIALVGSRGYAATSIELICEEDPVRARFLDMVG
jgi:AcrR family transcriptional regulator